MELGGHSNQMPMVLISPLMAHLIEIINMNLQEIKNKVLSLPTIMNLADELLIIDELMTIDVNDLIENQDIFKSIIDALELSHIDSGFMELTEENESSFINFYKWLNKTNNKFNLGINANTIDSFSLTVEDVKKMML
ncbi:hypothetical protein Q0T90_23330 [Escherichia coli D10:H20]